MRGLKLNALNVHISDYNVAPLVGAWIEIMQIRREHQYVKSHPLWVRGLKLMQAITRIIIAKVAPLVGAWIEMFLVSCLSYAMIVAPLVGAWIEMTCFVWKFSLAIRRTPCGCVD